MGLSIFFMLGGSFVGNYGCPNSRSVWSMFREPCDGSVVNKSHHFFVEWML
jgi:hypothetical protein